VVKNGKMWLKDLQGHCLRLERQQVIEVITGLNGILEGCHKDTKVICMSTIDKDNLEWVAGNAQKKCRFC